MPIEINTVKAERAVVAKNIQQLEGHIQKLNDELQQAHQNLLASRGAVLAFDRLLEVAEKPPEVENPPLAHDPAPADTEA
jgi:uncharacterized protein YegL